jgi:hypothetical protein
MPKRQKRRPQAEPTASILGYFRRIGLPLSLAIFGLGIMASTPSSWFWIAATAFYVGTFLLWLDVQNEGFFNSCSLLIRVTIGIVYLTLIVAFSRIWIFAPAALMMTGESRLSHYPEGAVVAGIKWEARFSEIRLKIANDTDNDYSDLVLRVETDLGINQLRPAYDSKPAYDSFGCSVFPDIPPISAPRVVHHWRDEQGIWHEEEGVSLPDENVGSWAYRITCSELPHDSKIDFVGALSNQNFNLKIGQSLYLPPRPARWVRMDATYTFRHERTANVIYCFEMGSNPAKIGLYSACADSLAPPSRFRHDPTTTIKVLQQREIDSTRHVIMTAVIVYSALIFLTPIAVVSRFDSSTFSQR